MTHTDVVPAHAEQLDMTKFFKAYDMPSKLLPNIKQRIWRLRCPQCSTEHDRPFEINHCACGLSMKLEGSLYVWREKEPPDVRA